MAFRPLLRPGRQLLYRKAIFHQPFQRFQPFSATAPAKDASSTASQASQFPGGHVILGIPHEMLEFLHSSGLAWGWVLPVSALIVRTLLAFPVLIPTRQRQQRYVALNPVRDALRASLHRHVMLKEDHNSPREARIKTMQATREEVNKLHNDWHCALGMSSLLPAWSLIVFLSMAETIRAMIGEKAGLLGLGVKGLQKTGLLASDVETAASEPMKAVIDTGTREIVNNPLLEPSFATEGVLWFPNLMVPDPELYLPFVVWGLMAYNIHAGASANQMMQSGWALALRRGLLFWSILIIPVTLEMPAGLLLYWASSTAAAIIWNKLMDFYYPIKTPPSICKRPLIEVPLRKRR